MMAPASRALLFSSPVPPPARAFWTRASPATLGVPVLVVVMFVASALLGSRVGPALGGSDGSAHVLRHSVRAADAPAEVEHGAAAAIEAAAVASAGAIAAAVHAKAAAPLLPAAPPLPPPSLPSATGGLSRVVLGDRDRGARTGGRHNRVHGTG